MSSSWFVWEFFRQNGWQLTPEAGYGIWLASTTKKQEEFSFSFDPPGMVHLNESNMSLGSLCLISCVGIMDSSRFLFWGCLSPETFGNNRHGSTFSVAGHPYCKTKLVSHQLSSTPCHDWGQQLRRPLRKKAGSTPAAHEHRQPNRLESDSWKHWQRCLGELKCEQRLGFDVCFWCCFGVAYHDPDVWCLYMCLWLRHVRWIFMANWWDCMHDINAMIYSAALMVEFVCHRTPWAIETCLCCFVNFAWFYCRGFQSLQLDAPIKEN